MARLATWLCSRSWCSSPALRSCSFDCCSSSAAQLSGLADETHSCFRSLLVGLHRRRRLACRGRARRRPGVDRGAQRDLRGLVAPPARGSRSVVALAAASDTLGLTRRARSSAGQSSGLIIRWSLVRIQAGPLRNWLQNSRFPLSRNGSRLTCAYQRTHTPGHAGERCRRPRINRAPESQVRPKPSLPSTSRGNATRDQDVRDDHSAPSRAYELGQARCQEEGHLPCL